MAERSRWKDYRVVEDGRSASVVAPDGTVQLRAVLVGKGVEFTRHPGHHGWVHRKPARKWAKAVARLVRSAGAQP